MQDFPDSSVSKESICNSGDPGSIPGLGRSAGEGIGYSLQLSWTSLVTQLVKNLPVVRETWVRALGLEDPLKKGKVAHSIFWPGEFHSMYSPWGCKESGMTYTICSDFGAQEKMSVTVCVFFPASICHEVIGLDAMIFAFWKLSFKPVFSLSSFTFIKRLFSSSSLSVFCAHFTC